MKKELPTHVAIILDGNGRWAKKRNLPRSMGHKYGSENLRKLSLEIFDFGIPVLSVFIFSTENFKRDQAEVDYLMNLFVEKFHKEFQVYLKENIKVVFSGRKEHLRNDVLEAMKEIEEKTKHNTKGILNFCLNYGGMQEIVDATKKIVSLNLPLEEINEQTFSHYLYQDLPPVDLLIRTSGEYRISNFLIYQSAYAEYYFTDTLFPDFKLEDFKKAIDAYQHRNRRFGGNHSENENH